MKKRKKFDFELDFGTWVLPIGFGVSKVWEEVFVQILCFRFVYHWNYNFNEK